MFEKNNTKNSLIKCKKLNINATALAVSEIIEFFNLFGQKEELYNEDIVFEEEVVSTQERLLQNTTKNLN